MSEPTWFILGAGAIGSALSYRLGSAGLAVRLLHHRAQLEPRVLHIGEREIPLTAYPLAGEAAQGIQYLILCTKAGQLAAAAAGARPFLAAHATVLTTANGLGFEADLSAALGAVQTFRAVSTAAAYRDARGHVFLAAPGTTRVGPAGTAGRRGVNAAPHWFLRGPGVLKDWQWEDPVDAAVAQKFAINCVINPLTAHFGCRNGELLQGDAARALAALCAETEPALQALGLWPQSTPLIEAVRAVCHSTRANRSSMLQDHSAGRQTEIAFLNGELLRRGRALGLHLPQNQALYDRLA